MRNAQEELESAAQARVPIRDNTVINTLIDLTVLWVRIVPFDAFQLFVIENLVSGAIVH
jgi:hypothetical protein